jgi:hypothetical protein
MDVDREIKEEQPIFAHTLLAQWSIGYIFTALSRWVSVAKW